MDNEEIGDDDQDVDTSYQDTEEAGEGIKEDVDDIKEDEQKFLTNLINAADDDDHNDEIKNHYLKDDEVEI